MLFICGFSTKYLVGSKKVRTFASAFEQKQVHELKKKELAWPTLLRQNKIQASLILCLAQTKSSLKDLHKQRSSTRSELHYLFSVVWVEKKRTVNLY